MLGNNLELPTAKSTECGASPTAQPKMNPSGKLFYSVGNGWRKARRFFKDFEERLRAIDPIPFRV